MAKDTLPPLTTSDLRKHINRPTDITQLLAALQPIVREVAEKWKRTKYADPLFALERDLDHALEHTLPPEFDPK